MTIEKEKIVLKPSQQQALTEMLNWCLDKESLTYTLTGRAGTGKTTVLNDFIKQNPFKYRLCVTAPTHKAKKVVSQKTGKSGETIQKLLGLRPDTSLDDFNINKPQFNMLAEAAIMDYSLIIIDEASMLNKNLFDYLLKEGAKYKTKILFVGDDAQINPVGETISQIFKVEKQSKLTEVIRQSGENPVMELFEILTKDIDNNTDNYLKFLRDNPKKVNDLGEGYECVSMDDFTSNMIKYFSSMDFFNNPDYCKYIAWTNKSVTGLNAYIRKNVLKSENLLELNELLMAYNTVSAQFNETVLINSDDYKVIEINEGSSNYNEAVIEGYRVKLSSETMNTDVFIVKPESYNVFLKEFNELLRIAKLKKGRAWINYFDFKKNHILMTDIVEGGKLIVKKDIDYGYGLTSHKSQGSTYENVFINLNDINNHKTPMERRRLPYVALSRMTKKAFILY